MGEILGSIQNDLRELKIENQSLRAEVEDLKKVRDPLKPSAPSSNFFFPPHLMGEVSLLLVSKILLHDLSTYLFPLLSQYLLLRQKDLTEIALGSQYS